ncbi:MAG: hypothetical protein ACJAYU_004651 [Bradymonadia bacterium]|jgi:hypothetical protein
MYRENGVLAAVGFRHVGKHLLAQISVSSKRFEDTDESCLTGHDHSAQRIREADRLIG